MTICEEGDEAGYFLTMKPWKQTERHEPYLAQNEEGMTPLVIRKSVEGVSVLAIEGQIAWQLVYIFIRDTMTSLICLCLEIVESRLDAPPDGDVVLVFV